MKGDACPSVLDQATGRWGHGCSEELELGGLGHFLEIRSAQGLRTSSLELAGIGFSSTDPLDS